MDKPSAEPTHLEPQLSQAGSFFTAEIYRKIGSYLSQRDKLTLHCSHSLIREITSNSTYWHTIQLINSSNKYLSKQLEWISKNMRKFKPINVVISLFETNKKIQSNLMSVLMEGTVDSVTNLDIYCESEDVHLACSLCFPNLEELTIRSRCVTNELVQYMSKSLSNLHSLIVIKNDMEFTCENLSKYMPNPMQKLVIKPYMIQFGEIQQISLQSEMTLSELEIDVEQCEEEEIIKILQPLRNLSKLRLYHLQNLGSDESLYKILEKQSKIEELAITKVYNFELHRILKVISSNYLLSLNINDCKYVQDRDIIGVAEACRNLREINVSWCNCLTSEGLSAVVKSCSNLEYFYMTGVKESRDWIFGEYLRLMDIFDESKFNCTKNMESMKDCSQIYEPGYFFKKLVERESIKSLRKLKILDCQSCNSISDNILKLIYIINPRARIYNYFGNYMGLFPHDNQSPFC